jgi:hypothetical protein
MVNKRDHSQKRLQAYIERRNRLWVQIKAAHPAFTPAEIDARLEVFGA